MKFTRKTSSSRASQNHYHPQVSLTKETQKDKRQKYKNTKIQITKSQKDESEISQEDSLVKAFPEPLSFSGFPDKKDKNRQKRQKRQKQTKETKSQKRQNYKKDKKTPVKFTRKTSSHNLSHPRVSLFSCCKNT